jgi:hypothetical protein
VLAGRSNIVIALGEFHDGQPNYSANSLLVFFDEDRSFLLAGGHGDVRLGRVHGFAVTSPPGHYCRTGRTAGDGCRRERMAGRGPAARTFG